MKTQTTPAELSALIKNKLGYNRKQVTVRKSSSYEFLKIVVRSHKVSLAKINSLAKSLYSWSMDNTDYCSGQSVEVIVEDSVKSVWAEIHLQAVKSAYERLDLSQDFDCQIVTENIRLIKDDQGFFVRNGPNGGRNRCHYVGKLSKSLQPDELQTLAYHVYTLIN